MDHYEIEACVVRAKNGSTEDLLMLLNQFKPYICKFAGKYRLKDFDTCELVQIGYSAVITAMKKYKVGSNTFSCYAIHSISNAFNDAIKKSARYESELSLNTQIKPNYDSSMEFLELLISPDNVEEEVLKSIGNQKLKEALSKLKVDEIELLMRTYLSNVSLKSYARKNRLNYATVLKKNKRLLAKLKRLI